MTGSDTAGPRWWTSVRGRPSYRGPASVPDISPPSACRQRSPLLTTPQSPATAVAFAQEQSYAHPHVVSDLAEMLGRVPIPEVSGPAAQECIDVPHDRFSIDEQPVPGRELTNPVPGMLHGLFRGPAGQELNRPTSIPGAGAHQPVVEAEEVEAFPVRPQVHDPRLGLLRRQPEFGQQAPQPLQG